MQISPAVLNWDVLGQAEVLVALRMTNPRDVAAIDTWIRLHTDPEQAAQLKHSLPALPVGTAWIWSPGWLERLDQVKIRPRRTFDPSATPKPGVTVRRPALAPVDVARLLAQLTPTAAPSTTPIKDAVVATRIRELERTVARLQNQPPRVVEVPILDAETRDQLTEALGRVDQLRTVLDRLSDAIAGALPATHASAATVAPPTTGERVGSSY